MRHRVLFEGAGSHGRYQIVERRHNGRRARLLLSGRAAQQSGIALDGRPDLPFNYNQRFLEIALSTRPRSVLVIGGGAFTLPRALLEHLPATTIDTVEIDTLLPQLAREYFDLPNSPRHTIISQDGREYINDCDKSYDLIIIDAFDEYDIPRSLLTRQAAQHYARLLTPTGLVAFNIISTYQGKPSLAHQLIATYSEVFSSLELYPADPEEDEFREQNLVFVASNQPSLQLDYLQSHCVHPDIPSEGNLRLVD